MRKAAVFLLDSLRLIAYYAGIRNTQIYAKMKDITLQIPFSLYGKIATLAAAANMPLDGFVVNTAEQKLTTTK